MPPPPFPSIQPAPDRRAARYFLVQAAVGAYFWFVVTGSAEGHELFDLLPGHPEVTDRFLLPDLVAIATSLASAWALWWGRAWAPVAVAFTTGCIVYPTVSLLGWAGASSGGANALIVMVPPSLIGLALTWRTWLRSQPHRGAPPDAPSEGLARPLG